MTGSPTEGDQDRPSSPGVTLASEHAGWAIVRGAWAGVGLQVVAAAGAVATRWGRGPHVAVCSLLLAGGIAASAVAFLRAVNRSRRELVDVAGLFLLIGSAPRRIRGLLWSAVGVSTVVGVAGATARPYTSLAFGVLAPLWPYGLTVLWNALHGTFPDRPERARPGGKQR